MVLDLVTSLSESCHGLLENCRFQNTFLSLFLFLQCGAGLAEGGSGGSGGGRCWKYSRQQVHFLGGGIPGHQGRQ